MAEPDRSSKPFMQALADAIRMTGHPSVSDDGNINWSVFARDLPTIHYETLRKIRSSDRALDKRTIEEVAKAAGVEPMYFAEYRLMVARERFDPRLVGFDQAIKNLEAWTDRGPAQRGSAAARARPVPST